MRTTSGALACLILAACAGGGVTPIRTHFNKGVYLYSHGDFEAAISEYLSALEEEPADHRARFNLAMSEEALADRLEQEGRAEAVDQLRARAEARYRELLGAHPENLRAAVNLAAREIARGDRSAGEARLRKAIAEHPAAVLPRTALAAHTLRAAGADRTALQTSIALLESALEQEPANPGANMLLGWACARLAEQEPEREALLARARRAYATVLEGNPQDLATLLALGRLELMVENAAAAEPWLRRALYVDAGHLEAHWLMAETLETLGDLEGATFHLWRSRELENTRAPRHPPAEYSERLLDLYRRLAEREQAPR